LRKPDAALVCAACVVVHAPSFFRTIASANEGLYAVVAREVVNGHLPYLTAWEAKPPLFFAVAALAMRIFGTNFTAMHALSLAAAVVTALSVMIIGRCFEPNGRAIGLIAGVTCAALFASDSGTAIEGEALACAPASAAFAIVCRAGWKLRPSQSGVMGLLAGATLGMKMTVAPVAAVIAVAAALAGGGGGAFAAAAGIAAVLAAMIVPYGVTGHIDALLDANIATITRRIGVAVPHPPIGEIVRQQIEAFFPAWLIAPGIGAAWRAERPAEGRRIVTLMLAWLTAGLLSVIAIHEYFGYQWTTMMPPAALIAAWAFVRLCGSVPLRYAAVTVTLIAHVAGTYGSLSEPDPYAVVASFLQTLPSGERTSLYVATDNAGLYVLAGAPLPTRYPDGAHLYSLDMQRASGSPGQREIARILADHPALVAVDAGIVNRAPAKAYLDRQIAAHYHVIFSVGTHEIWRRDDVSREFKRSSSRAYSTAVRSAIFR
jgi:hypothetical protein